jgi:putative nucleotidyltransferase with HDIG domain
MTALNMMTTKNAPTEDEPSRLILVDDDDIVRETIGEALKASGYEVTVAASGDEALEHLRSDVYHLVLTDLVMPGMSGTELCRQVVAMLPHVPVVLITGHGNVDVARESLDVGAADFVSKPINLSDLPIVVERNIQRQKLQAQRAMERSAAVLLQAVQALIQALDERDNSTAEHSQRVSDLAVELGRKMGLEEDQLYSLRLAALLHDVGKIGIRDHVLLKEGRLSDEENSLMRLHPIKGAEILSRIEELSDVISAVLHHHENFDGTGYPNGLKGVAIPLYARIIRVADTWDAMTSDRIYRPGMPKDKARAHFLEFAGRLYDPEISEHLIRRVDELYGLG